MNKKYYVAISAHFLRKEFVTISPLFPPVKPVWIYILKGGEATSTYYFIRPSVSLLQQLAR